jgi:hypothetical protein
MEQKIKISHMDWRPIQITGITFYFSELTIGNTLALIKYKNSGLKFSQLLTGISKNFNAVTEEPEKTPDWLTTGITYLIPKSGDSKDVRNCRPIT